MFGKSTIMKKLFIIMVLISTISKAQEKISIGIYQDAKLSIMKDNYGNIPFTPDVIITVNLEGKQFKHYYFSVQPFYEFADLHGGKFHRYGINTNWNLNQLIIPNTTITAGLGLGMIHRFSMGTPSYQANLEIKHKLAQWIELAIRTELVRRSELENPQFKPNLSYGVVFNL